jgi:hypothetical protein
MCRQKHFEKPESRKRKTENIRQLAVDNDIEKAESGKQSTVGSWQWVKIKENTNYKKNRSR